MSTDNAVTTARFSEVVDLLTNAENQPHQFVGNPDEAASLIRESLTNEFLEWISKRLEGAWSTYRYMYGGTGQDEAWAVVRTLQEVRSMIAGSTESKP